MTIAVDHPAAVLDEAMPVYAHHEVHTTLIDADPQVVWRALQEVTPAELRLSRFLMALRSLPGRLSGRRAGTFAGESSEPLVRQLSGARFAVLGEDPPHGSVVGAVGRPWRLRSGTIRPSPVGEAFAAFDEPGLVKIVTSFAVSGDGRGHSTLRTETRVQPTDGAAARAFGRYWFVIRFGSGLIRREMLRAVRMRAQRG